MDINSILKNHNIDAINDNEKVIDRLVAKNIKEYKNEFNEKINQNIVNGIDEKKLNNILGNRDELKTTNKNNIVNAINEVFQCGNNVKFNTVDALLQVDRTLQITKEDSWNDIIKNIGKISTGKKFARGEKNGDLAYLYYPTVSSTYMVINWNLNFNPTIIKLFFKEKKNNSVRYACSSIYYENKWITHTDYNFPYLNFNIIDVSEKEFKIAINTQTNNNNNAIILDYIQWIAIE